MDRRKPAVGGSFLFPVSLALSVLLHLSLLLVRVPASAPSPPEEVREEVKVVNAVVLKVPPVFVPVPERIPAPAAPKPEELPPPPSPPEPPVPSPAQAVIPREAAPETAPSEAFQEIPSQVPAAAADNHPRETARPETPSQPGSGTGSSTPQEQPASRAVPAAEKYFMPFYRVDVKPAFLREAELQYPVQARRMNVEGVVIVEADIEEDGRITGVRVVKKAGFGFDEAAVRYIRESLFSPAMAGNRNVPVRMRFTVRFSHTD